MNNKSIAYFCAEYAAEDSLQIYAGGLGILSGDLLRQAGGQGLTWNAIGLFYQRGFAMFSGSEGLKRPSLNPSLFGFELLREANGAKLQLPIEIYDRVAHVQVWHKKYGSANLYLLDANTELNSASDRLITESLYDENFTNRLLQEVILGIGGVKLLRHLKITPDIYHLNEGHTSFAILALALEYLHDHPCLPAGRRASNFTAAFQAVRTKIVATKHTILPGAGLYFTKEQFRDVISCYFNRHHASFDEFFEIGKADDPVVFSTTKFLLEGSRRSSAVSQLHAFFEKTKHPHSPLIPITNGIYEPRWKNTAWHDFEPASDADLWRIHCALRGDLIKYVDEQTGAKLNPQALTIVWARRFAGYKRPGLLFSDIKKLHEITHRPATPVQIIIAGKAHPNDREGNEIIERVKAHAKSPEFSGIVVYLPHYSIRVARILTSGADIWLNTPELGKEASGTSGMKSALNGGLQCSIMDGWMGEIDWDDKGWTLPEQNVAQEMYNTIEQKIVPAFYTLSADGIPLEWTQRMRKTIAAVKSEYNIKRTLKNYFEKLYF